MRKIESKTFIAFKMKFTGNKYEEISKQTGYSLHTLKKYFSKDGRWYKKYWEWSTEQSNEMIGEANRILKRNAKNAATVVVHCLGYMSTKPRIALKAAWSILDRVGIGKQDEIASDSFKRDPAEEMVRALEQYGAKKTGV
jgi:hypothetical protein